MNIYFKWLLIVVLNSIYAFTMGFKPASTMHITGILAGMATWYCIYVKLDSFLIRSNRKHISKRLCQSAIIRIPIQFFQTPDLMAGVFAIFILDYFGLNYTFGDSFIASYLMTILTGLALNTMCAFIFLCITCLQWLWDRYAKLATSSKAA